MRMWSKPSGPSVTLQHDDRSGAHQVAGAFQFRLAAGLALWSGKVRLDAEGTYDMELKQVPDQRYRIEYYTQCCGFLADYLQRDFTALTRREFRFTVDLRGIGRLFDLHESTE